MRVGLVCPYSLDVHGGVQSHVLGLAATLAKRGHEVAVLAPGEGAGRGGAGPAYVTTTGRSVPMPYNGSVARVSFGPLVAARVRRWLDAGRFDVLHIHEPATPSVSVLALWGAQCPVVATFHTAQDPTRVQGWLMGTSAATLLRSGLRKIDAHLAVSDEAGRTMARYVAARPEVIPNGIDGAALAAVRDRRISGGPAEASAGPSLLFLGRIDEPRKGLAVLLDALPALVRAHPGLRLTVAGAGTPPVVPRAAATHVRFAGPVAEREKLGLLGDADVLVAPNVHGESFGIVLAEAMAAGTPVLASDLPSFVELLQHGRCGTLFPVGDAAGLAREASALLGDGARRALLAASASAASDAFDWPVVAARVQHVYDSVVVEEGAAVG